MYMSEFGPVPSREALETEREQWAETHDTRERIEDIVVGFRGPTSVAEIAESAHCSANAARKHLSQLADLGIVCRVSEQGTTCYTRNDEYFRWRRANELATEHHIEELLAGLERLEATEERFRERYRVPTPADIEFSDDADHAAIHERWEVSGEWETVRREIALHKEAIRMARRREELPA